MNRKLQSDNVIVSLTLY